MNKIICDVCGTDYPETAAQCPICGCASAGAQTAAGNEVSDAEEKAYTPVKGGRFSKANVRKRLKNSQMYYDPIPEPDPEPEYEDDEIPEEEEEEEDRGSNRGLVIVVAILLLAIVAVATYIAISIFGVGNQSPVSTNKPGTNQNTTTTAPTTDPTTEPTSTTVKVDCEDLNLSDDTIELKGVGATWQLMVTRVPDTTTEQVSFISSNLDVVKVDNTGCVTATGIGEAFITVSCGEVTKNVPVICIEENTDATDPTDPTENTDPVEVPDDFVLKLNRKDFTLSKAGDTHNLYKGDVPASEITWESLDETVVTVKDGVVTAVGKGRTQVVAKYGDQEVSCWVSSNAKNTQVTEPTEPTEPSATEPEEEETASYTLLVNGRVSPYGDEHNAEVTISVDEGFSLTVTDEAGANQSVEWKASKEGICSVNGKTITGESAGKVTLSATIDGVTLKCVIIVK